MMNRRSFSTALLAGAAASLISTRGMAATSTPVKARNVVLVHGLFADGSSWSEVIARLQAAGLNATAVQNPLTTLPEAVASAQRVLARQDGPTVLVGHSFSGMKASHLSLISHPDEITRLILEAAGQPRGEKGVPEKEPKMRILNIVTSPRGERSPSIAVVDSFLVEYKKKIK